MESDGGSTSSMINLFADEINHQDIQELFNVQRDVLEHLDKTNERLDGLNKLSAQRYLQASKQFEKHSSLLSTMKTDLDTILKRIKFLKTQLNLKYPDAYNTAIQINSHRSNSLDEEDDVLAKLPLKISTNPPLVKSKTIDYSEMNCSMRETISLAELNNVPTVNESSPRSFDALRRFVFQNSPTGQDLSSLLKNARDELKKFNDGFLSKTNPNEKN